MITIDVNEMQRDFPGYMQKVNAGETLRILQAGTPIAEIQPIEHMPVGLRPIGLCAGEFTVPDNFDEPLPDDVLNGFEHA